MTGHVELDELDRLQTEATRAPWWISESGDIRAGEEQDSVSVGETDWNTRDEYFVLTLRNAYPALAEELRQSRARVAELEQKLRWFRAAHLLVSMEYGWLRHPDRLKGDEFCYASLDMDRDEPVIYLLCSDTFAWGCADAERAEYVDAEKLLDIAKSDGWVGLMRWVQQRRAERGIQEEPMPQVAANFARYDRIKERAESAEARVKELESRSVGALEGHLAAAREAAQANAARVKELEAENARLRAAASPSAVSVSCSTCNDSGFFFGSVCECCRRKQEGGPDEG